MKKKTFQVTKAREDQQVEETVTRLVTPNSFIRDLPPMDILEAFKQLMSARFDDYHKILEGRNAPPEDYLDPARKEERSEILAECAWEYFEEHARDKFRVALVELIHESLCFADAIDLERCGASEEDINSARPTNENIQQNVLRHSVKRLNALPLQTTSDGWKGAENDEQFDPLTRAVATMFNNIPLWAYDHVRVYELLREQIRPWLEKHEDPDEEAHVLANESAEFIWEHIAGAVQMLLNTLVSYALLLSRQSAAQRYGMELTSEALRLIQQPKSKLKETVEFFFEHWLDKLDLEFRGSGRLMKTETTKTAERRKLLTELQAIARKIRSNGDRVTWESLAANRRRPKLDFVHSCCITNRVS